MKHIAQFRFKGNGHIENYPINLRQDELVGGNIFRNYGPVSQLGIQAPVGMRFYLNDSIYPIVVGETGIYELDLKEVGRITSIKFNKNDLETFYPKDGGILANKTLIDIVYEGA